MQIILLCAKKTLSSHDFLIVKKKDCAYTKERIDTSGALLDADGQGSDAARPFEDVLEVVRDGDVPAGIQLHCNCADNQFLHRCRYLSSDKTEYSESVDAEDGGRIYDA